VDKYVCKTKLKILQNEISGNEVTFQEFKSQNISLFIFCQGIGDKNNSYIVGKVVSKAIVFHFKKLKKKGIDIAAELKNAFIYAYTNLQLHGIGTKSKVKLSTSISVLLVINNNFYVAHLGDTAVFLKNKNGLHRLTTRHSVADDLLYEKKITLPEYLSHPLLYSINKTLNQLVFHEPVIMKGEFEINSDSFIMCSDYIASKLEENNLKVIINNSVSEEIINKINENIKKDSKNFELIGISVIFFKKIFKLKFANKKPSNLVSVIISLLLLIIIFIFVSISGSVGVVNMGTTNISKSEDMYNYEKPTVIRKGSQNTITAASKVDSLKSDSLNKIILAHNKRYIKND
jgi:protein phosphatase